MTILRSLTILRCFSRIVFAFFPPSRAARIAEILLPLALALGAGPQNAAPLAIAVIGRILILMVAFADHHFCDPGTTT
jgi:hypothetical protein